MTSGSHRDELYTLWQKERINDLPDEFERCFGKFSRFTQLMQRRKARPALLWLTERDSRQGVVYPISMVDSNASVTDVLKN